MGIGFGAVIGGIAGYLFLTERGRDFRVQLEPRLNELLGEVDQLRTTFERTRSAVSEGWQSFNQLMKDAPPQAADAWDKAAPRGPAH